MAERGEASVDVAAGSSTQGGSADIGNEEETITVESIVAKEPRSELARLTKEDPTLKTARALADTLSEGYH